MVGSNALLGRIVITCGQLLDDAYFGDLVSHVAIEFQPPMICSEDIDLQLAPAETGSVLLGGAK